MPENITTQPLPHNPEAERTVLGSLLLTPSTINQVGDFLKPQDFFLQRHKFIYQAILDLTMRGDTLEIFDVEKALDSRGVLDECGGLVYLSHLLEGTASSANVRYYAEIIKKKAHSREFIDICAKYRELGISDKEEVDQLISSAEVDILKIATERQQRDFTHIKDILQSAVTQIQELARRKEGELAGLSTGVPALDRLTTGLKEGDYFVIAGRPSAGKTAFCLHVARHAALQEKRAVGIFSLEMSREALALRMLCAEAKVSSQKLRAGILSNADWKAIAKASERLAAADILIDDTPGIGPIEMRARARRIQTQFNAGLYVVDYLQLMTITESTFGKRRLDGRQQEISEISRNMKFMAKELKAPVIVLSQLNRSIEVRKEKTPMLSDLRESGAIEQDADLVAFLTRADENQGEGGAAPEPPPGFAHRVDLTLAKQRNGPTGTVQLVFFKDTQQFGQYSGEEQDHDSGGYE